MNVARLRLKNQRLVGAGRSTPAETVEWLGAMQAQDYLAAKWAVGLRAGLRDAEVEAAHDRGDVLRTHVLRPTWHFVRPRELAWMRPLSAPRIRRTMAAYDRRLGFVARTIAKTLDAFAKAVEGGRDATRDELGARVRLEGPPLAHALIYAEVEGLLTSGPRRGKQHTYAAFDARVPKAAKANDRDELAAALARVYFRARGPATEGDFRWWSGLSAPEARAAIASLANELETSEIGGRKVWLFDAGDSRARSTVVRLLPAFDEYLVAYEHRGDVLDPIHTKRINAGGGLLAPTIVVNGRVVGTWKRVLSRDSVEVILEHFDADTRSLARAIEREADRYREHLGLSRASVRHA